MKVFRIIRNFMAVVLEQPSSTLQDCCPPGTEMGTSAVGATESHSLSYLEKTKDDSASGVLIALLSKALYQISLVSLHYEVQSNTAVCANGQKLASHRYLCSSYSAVHLS